MFGVCEYSQMQCGLSVMKIGNLLKYVLYDIKFMLLHYVNKVIFNTYLHELYYINIYVHDI